LGDVRVLFHLKSKGPSRYHELLRVLKSRSTLADSLKDLQRMDLIERKIKDTRPIQTEYSLTERGVKVVHLLSQLSEIVEE
jgi:DNA-binding HxlR family transcriptional regulator